MSGKNTDRDSAPEIPDPPDHPEWKGVETWSRANLRYPIPGGWDIHDHSPFHTTWVHDSGGKLTRSSKQTPGPKDTFTFKLDGTKIHRVDTGPNRSELREQTVWLLTFYDNHEDINTAEAFEERVREKQNRSLGDFA